MHEGVSPVNSRPFQEEACHRLSRHQWNRGYSVLSNKYRFIL